MYCCVMKYVAATNIENLIREWKNKAYSRTVKKQSDEMFIHGTTIPTANGDYQVSQ